MASSSPLVLPYVPGALACAHFVPENGGKVCVPRSAVVRATRRHPARRHKS